MRGVIVRPVPVRSIPNSTNTWEAIYDVPPMSDAEKNEVIENPFEVRAQPHTHIPGSSCASAHVRLGRRRG